MKLILTAFTLVLFSCNSTKKSANVKDFPSGKYDVLELKAEKFKAEKTYTININTEEKRIAGTFDCNNFSCEYERDGQNIDFGYAIATKMYCEGMMHNENAFFSKLNSLKTFKYDGEELSFFNEEDELILKLKKQKS